MTKFFEWIKTLFSTPTLKESFEDIILKEAIKEQDELALASKVEPQITDAVTVVEQKVKKTRARKTNK